MSCGAAGVRWQALRGLLYSVRAELPGLQGWSAGVRRSVCGLIAFSFIAVYICCEVSPAAPCSALPARSQAHEWLHGRPSRVSAPRLP